jgi:hypothetical protein
LFLSVKHNLRVGRQLTITPLLSYTNQTPWKRPPPPTPKAGLFPDQRTAEQSVDNGPVRHFPQGNLTFGGDTSGTSRKTSGVKTTSGRAEPVQYHTASVFAQGL